MQVPAGSLGLVCAIKLVSPDTDHLSRFRFALETDCEETGSGLFLVAFWKNQETTNSEELGRFAAEHFPGSVGPVKAKSPERQSQRQLAKLSQAVENALNGMDFDDFLARQSAMSPRRPRLEVEPQVNQISIEVDTYFQCHTQEIGRSAGFCFELYPRSGDIIVVVLSKRNRAPATFRSFSITKVPTSEKPIPLFAAPAVVIRRYARIRQKNAADPIGAALSVPVNDEITVSTQQLPSAAQAEQDGKAVEIVAQEGARGASVIEAVKSKMKHLAIGRSKSAIGGLKRSVFLHKLQELSIAGTRQPQLPAIDELRDDTNLYFGRYNAVNEVIGQLHRAGVDISEFRLETPQAAQPELPKLETVGQLACWFYEQAMPQAGQK